MNPQDAYDSCTELVKEKSPALFCDNCGHYPIEPIHGYFVCPACHIPTKCCEVLCAAARTNRPAARGI